VSDQHQVVQMMCYSSNSCSIQGPLPILSAWGVQWSVWLLQARWRGATCACLCACDASACMEAYAGGSAGMPCAQTCATERLLLIMIGS
jgi:hypothetical protein